VTTAIIAEAHEGIAGGHFSAKITLHKILTALYWWPTMKRDVHLYCTQCDICQRVGPKISQNLQPLHPTMPTEVFQKWGLDFIGPVNPPAKGTKNRYIITATDYTTKWVEARALKDNTAKSTAKFLFEEITTKFGCPLEFVSDQGSHFINDTIKVLTQEFMILHRKSTTYYPQANGQAESTNKVIKIALTKMVNANRTDWDTKLHAALWAYRTAYKVTTKHTPFSLVFGTEALLPMAYLHPDVYQKRNQEFHPILEKRMEQLRTMDLTRHEAEENMKHMQLLRKERHDKPRAKRQCRHCDPGKTKPPQEKTKKNDTLEDDPAQAMEKSQNSRSNEDGEHNTTPKTRFYPGQRVLWHLRHKIPGPGKFKIRWAGPYLIQQVYDNGSVDVTTLQGDSLGRVNMNKLKPYQEPESTQAYALQILARHILEKEIRAKQNHLYKETSTTQIPLTTSSQPNEGTISHTGSTSYQSQETLDAEDSEMHSVMLEVYHIHPSTQDNIHPKDGRTKLPMENTAHTTSPQKTLTLVRPKRVMKQKPHIMKGTRFIDPTLPPLEQGRGEQTSN
jgi:hypothetical protein